LFTLLGVAFVVFSFIVDTTRRPRRRVRQARRSTSEPFRVYFVVWRPGKLAVFIDGLLHGVAVRRPAG
jgi:hypothetical protein